MKHFIILLSFSLALVPSLLAQKHVRTVKERFQVGADASVFLDVRFGDVTVTPSDGNVVDAVVTITVNDGSRDEAKRQAEAVAVEMKMHGEKFTLRTNLPKGENKGIEIDVRIAMPKGGHLYAVTKFGDANVSGIAGSAKVNSSFGNVEVIQSSNVEVESSYGFVSLSDIAENFRVEAKMGDVKVFNVPLGTIQSSYGDVEVSRPNAAVNISSSMGEISVKDCRGGSIKSSYGDVDIVLSSSFNGAIQAEASFGEVDSNFPMEEVGKKNKYGPSPDKKKAKLGAGSDRLSINSSFGDVDIRRR